MTTKFLVIGLPASFTSEQLRQLFAGEASDLQTAEMLPDTIATGVGYVKMADMYAMQRALRRFASMSMEHILGVRPLICGDDSVTFLALSKRWETERVATL